MCRCADAQMCRCADPQMRRCADAQMRRCADAQILRLSILRSIGIRRRVSKGVEDGRRPPALVSCVGTRKVYKVRAWRAQVKL
jgi:hypothetical protein